MAALTPCLEVTAVVKSEVNRPNAPGSGWEANMQITDVQIRQRDWRDRNRNAKTRVYVWPKGESVFENFGNRIARPHLAWRPLVAEALNANGFAVTERDLRWSQKAGCSCGCSPGFILQTADSGRDVSMTLEADAPQVTDPDAAATRQLALLNDPTIVGALQANIAGSDLSDLQ